MKRMNVSELKIDALELVAALDQDFIVAELGDGINIWIRTAPKKRLKVKDADV